MKRILLTVSFLCSIFIATATTASHHTSDDSGKLDVNGNFRLFLKHNNITIMSEYIGRIEGADSKYRYQSLSLGPYYRIHDNIKLGIFYKTQFGARHDNDWVRPEVVGEHWVWQDNRKRDEHLGIADITFRFFVPFVTNKNLMFELKNRYLFNSFNKQHTITTRPGLRYFIFHKRKPLLNLFIQYDLYFPLNYGVTTIYEQWLYAGFLYHFTQSFQAGLYASYKQQTWGPSKQFKSSFPDEDFKETHSSFIIGITAIGRIDF